MDLRRPNYPASALFAFILAVTGQVSYGANSAPVFNTLQALMPDLQPGGNPMTEDEVLTIAVNTGAPSSDANLLSALNINDIDEADTALGIAVTAVSGNGEWQYLNASAAWVALPAVSAGQPFLLGPAHQLRYDGDDANAETATLTFYLWDGTQGTARSSYTLGGAPGGATAFSSETRTSSVPVSAVQDPAQLNSVTATVTGNDNASVFAFTGATVDDVDLPGDTLTVRITVSPKTNGSLAQTGSPSVSFSETGTNTGIYTATGPEASIEAALQLLKFQPVANLAPVGTNTATTLSATVSDGQGPPGTDDNASVSLSIASVNDNPVINPASAARFAFSRGSIPAFSGFSINDADIVSGGGRQTVSMSITETFTLADGSFVLADGSTSSSNPLIFSARSIEAALSELAGLRYVASSVDLVAPEDVTLTLLVTDQAGGTRTAVVTVTVATPVVTSNIRGTESGQPILDNGVRRLFEGVSITGSAVASLEVTARIATGILETKNALAEGVGDFVETGGGSPLFTRVNNVLRFAGGASDATNALRQLAFKPIPNRFGAVETIQFELALKNAASGPLGTDSRTTAEIIPVNDLPTFIKFHTLNAIQDSESVSPFDIVEIGDADVNGVQPLSVSVELVSSLPPGTADHPVPGILTGLAAPGFVVDSLNTALYKFAGTPQQATTAIQALLFTPTPNRLDPGMNETVTFRVRLEDGSGDVVVRDQVKILVISENDTPVVTAPPTGTLEVISGNVIAPFGGTELGDGDRNERVTVRIELDDAAKGRLVDATGLFGEAPVGSGIYLATGLVGPVPSALQSALQGLEFELKPGYPVPAGQPGVAVQLRVTITDRQAAKVEFFFSLMVRIDQAARVVVNTNDSGAGSLRQAIAEANDNDHIAFDWAAIFGNQLTATIHLQSPLIIDKNLTVIGPGTEKLFISGDADGNGAADVQLFQVGVAETDIAPATSAYLHLSYLSLTHGSDEGSVFGNGGAVSVGPGSTLVLDHAEVLNCVAEQWGGAIDVEAGKLTVSNSLFAGNVTGGSLGQGGGAISIHTNQACAISNVTFSGNKQQGASGSGGGALYVENSLTSLPFEVAITHCTFAGNADASEKGTSIRTNVFNTAVSLRNCLFADGDPNPLDPRGAGRILSLGGNVADDDATVVISQGGVPQTLVLLDHPSDRTSRVLPLDTLADNGGQTRTHALPTGSPARGAGVAGSGLAIDQRDVRRVSLPDAGAFESISFKRLVINEIQFDPAAGNAAFIELVNPRDSETTQLENFEVWVTGVKRHIFTPVSLVPGTAVLVRDSAGTLAPTPPGGLPTQPASVGGSLGLGGTGGVVEIRAPDPDGAGPMTGGVLASAMYLAKFRESGFPGAELRLAHESVTRSSEFLGGMLPGPPSPGEDVLHTPLLEGNAPPIAFDDSVETNEDTAQQIDVLANDFDADRLDVIRVQSLPAIQSALGAALTIVNAPTPGAAVLYNPTVSPTIQAIPLGSERIDTFDYVILDYANGLIPHGRVRDPAHPALNEAADNLLRATGTATVRIIGVNDAPTPVEDKPATLPLLATTEDAVLTFAADILLDNDTDPDTAEGGRALRICWVKPVGFDLQDKDPTKVALSDLQTDTTLGGHVKLTLRADRSLSTIEYDPTGSERLNALSVGEIIEDSFSYLVIDIHGAPGLAVVRIKVTGVNDVPVATNDGPFAANEDTSLTIPFSPDILGNDTDVDQDGTAPNDVLTVFSSSSTSSLGAVITRGATAFTYNPSAAPLLQQLSKKEVVQDQFQYTVSDGHGGTSTATVLLRVSGVNDAPVATNDTYLANEDTSVGFGAGVGVLANDIEIDRNSSAPDDVLRALPVSTFLSVLGATVKLYGDGSFDYLPEGRFERLGQGEQAADSFTYTATDDGLVFSNDDSYRVAAGSANVLLPVLQNDVNFGIPPQAALVVKAAGSATQGGTAVPSSDGLGVIYSPAFGFVGTETFVYQIAAGDYGFCLAQVTVQVVPGSAPIEGKSDQFTVAPNSTVLLDLLANDLALPGGTSVALLEVVVLPNHGGAAEIVFQTGRTVVQYSPAPGFTGIETFSYQATAGGGTVFGATVTVRIPVRTGALSAQNDTFMVVSDTTDNALPVLANDGILPAAATGWTIAPTGLGNLPGGGSVAVAADGQSLLYSPAAGFVGSKTFSYIVTDAFGGTGTATVTVISGSPAFEALSDTFAVNWNSTGNILPVIANDLLIPNTGQKIDITFLTDPPHGTAAWNSSRSAIVYSPDAGYAGADTFTYEIGVASHPRRSATVTVNVVNRTGLIPASDDSFCVAGDSRLNVLRVLANDGLSGLNGLPLTLGAFGAPNHGGTLDYGSNQAFLFYTPAPGFIGTETFTYGVSDGRGGTGTASVSVKVGAIFAGDDTFTVVSGSTGNLLDVLANDRRIPGGRPQLGGIVTAPTGGGSAVLNGAGNAFIYQPASSSFVGIETFTYRVVNDSGESFPAKVTVRVARSNSDRSAGTVAVTVRGANDAPTLSGVQAFDFLRDDDVLKAFSTVVIGEVDSNGLQSLTVKVVIDNPAKGKLVNTGTGPGFTEGPPGTYTFVGTAAAVTTAIRNLCFVPTDNRLEWATHETVTFTIRISDGIAPELVNSGTTVVVYNIGQQFADNWIFGNGCTLSWNERRQLTIGQKTPFGFPLGGGASWSDPFTGEWLLYSDGVSAWDPWTGQVITGASGTLGGAVGDVSSIPAMIIPKPGGDPRVNLFILAFSSNNKNIRFTEVDLSIGAAGAVVGLPGREVVGSSSSQLGWVIVPHANGSDYWLVVGSGNAYPIRSTGVGTPVANFNLDGSGASFRYSPDGLRIAVGWSSPKMYIYDFNPANGVVSSNRIELGRGSVFFEFSHDGKKLYVNDTATQALYQYNVGADPGPAALPATRSAAVQATELLLHSYAAPDFAGDMALGPDGRIFIAGDNAAPAKLHVIANPNGAGAASGLQLDAIVLPVGCTLRQGLYHGLRTDDLINELPPIPYGPFESGRISSVSNSAWTTVTLDRTYTSMVVVATPEYANTTVPPIVTRIRNATANKFEVQLARADALTTAVAVPVNYLVVEARQYTVAADGIKMEAVSFSSTTTDRKGSWAGVARSYLNSYTSPVVVGQVMTSNDPRFSVFWARGSSVSNPPATGSLFVGKHIGADSVITRVAETIGYIIIESGSGHVGQANYAAFVGADTVLGVDDTPPFQYTFASTPNPVAVVVSSAAMDDNDGGWPVLFGPTPFTSTLVKLAIDEDRFADAERSHLSEQVAVVALGDFVSSPLISASVAALERWRETHFEAAALADPGSEATLWGLDADPDGDGRKNLGEYAFGFDPRSADLDDALRISLEPSVLEGQSRLIISYVRPADDGLLRYVLERSADLHTWGPASARPLRTIAIPDTAYEEAVLAVEEPLDVAGSFFRVRVAR